MSPQDTVERVLKEIHIAFSKCESYNGQSDKIIMDRKQFIDLLDRLNTGIYDMMENYEQTKNSRDLAERAFKKKGDEIIEDASRSAEDIYAASVIYTADAIGKIRDLMDQTNDSMNDLFRQFRKELKEQKDTLKVHENELESQLTELADSRKYLTIIRDVNTQRNRKNRDLKAEREAGRVYVQNLTRTPAPAAKATADEESAKQSEEPAKQAEAPDIFVNKDAEYFKWKEAEAKKAEAESAEEAENQEVAETEVMEDVTEAEEVDVEEIEVEAEEPAKPAIEPRLAPLKDPIIKALPTEEEIRQKVLEDERKAAAEAYISTNERRREGPGAGHILKTLIFGKSDD